MKLPLCILLTVLMFMIIFLGLVMLNFNRSMAHQLELNAADLETKLKLYETILDRLDKQTKENNEIYITALLKKRYLVQCLPFTAKLSGTSQADIEKGKSPIKVSKNVYEDFTKFKENLISIDEVHMMSFVGMQMDLPKGLRRFTDKYVDFGMKLKKGEDAKFMAEWKSNNVEKVEMQICALVSGNRKVK